MNPDENDALWKLLGKADRKPDISPTFAQNVVREARQTRQDADGFWGRFVGFFTSEEGEVRWLRPAAALGAVAAIAITLVVVNQKPADDPGLVNVDPVAPAVESDPVFEEFEDEMSQIDQFEALITVSDVDDLADEEIAMLLF